MDLFYRTEPPTTQNLAKMYIWTQNVKYFQIMFLKHFKIWQPPWQILTFKIPNFDIYFFPKSKSLNWECLKKKNSNEHTNSSFCKQIQVRRICCIFLPICFCSTVFTLLHILSFSHSVSGLWFTTSISSQFWTNEAQ